SSGDHDVVYRHNSYPNSIHDNLERHQTSIIKSPPYSIQIPEDPYGLIVLRPHRASTQGLCQVLRSEPPCHSTTEAGADIFLRETNSLWIHVTHVLSKRRLRRLGCSRIDIRRVHCEPLVRSQAAAQPRLGGRRGPGLRATPRGGPGSP